MSEVGKSPNKIYNCKLFIKFEIQWKLIVWASKPQEKGFCVGNATRWKAIANELFTLM
jgi:hypothetical protein